MKRISLSELWSVNLVEAGIDLDERGILSAVLTRSIASRMKFVLATHDKLVVLTVKDGQVETQNDYERAQVPDIDTLKLIPV